MTNLKMTKQEVGNYLLRFYESIMAKGPIPIGNNNFVLTGCAGNDFDPPTLFVQDSLNLDHRLYFCPAWKTLCEFIFNLRDEPSLIYDYGITEIFVQIANNREVGRIPFVLSFDMKNDTKRFIETARSIDSVVLLEPKPGELVIKYLHRNSDDCGYENHKEAT